MEAAVDNSSSKNIGSAWLMFSVGMGSGLLLVAAIFGGFIVRARYESRHQNIGAAQGAPAVQTAGQVDGQGASVFAQGFSNLAGPAVSEQPASSHASLLQNQGQLSVHSEPVVVVVADDAKAPAPAAAQTGETGADTHK